jgi:hypothetical protein
MTYDKCSKIDKRDQNLLYKQKHVFLVIRSTLVVYSWMGTVAETAQSLITVYRLPTKENKLPFSVDIYIKTVAYIYRNIDIYLQHIYIYIWRPPMLTNLCIYIYMYA